MDDHDITANAAAQIAPLAEALFGGLRADFDESDAELISLALIDALKVGIRLGGAEVAGTIRESLAHRGINLDVYLTVVDPSDQDGAMEGDA